MSEKTKDILGMTNKVLGILCAVMFIVAACRVTNVFVQHADSVSKDLVLKIENNEIKK